jgi:hypothetical protein
MTVVSRARAGITFRPEKSHDQHQTLQTAGWNPGGAGASGPSRFGLPKMKPFFRSAEKLLQNLFKKIDYLAHRTEIRRG